MHLSLRGVFPTRYVTVVVTCFDKVIVTEGKMQVSPVLSVRHIWGEKCPQNACWHQFGCGSCCWRLVIPTKLLPAVTRGGAEEMAGFALSAYCNHRVLIALLISQVLVGVNVLGGLAILCVWRGAEQEAFLSRRASLSAITYC